MLEVLNIWSYSLPMSNTETKAKSLDVKWTAPAEEEVNRMAEQPRFQGISLKKWHEDKVRAYGEAQVPQATKARIRWGKKRCDYRSH